MKKFEYSVLQPLILRSNGFPNWHVTWAKHFSMFSIDQSLDMFRFAGKVTHIPSSMVKDQFGMVGLLTFIRAAETDPNLVTLALGQDLTALGLNLNSPENLYQNFGGPWAETPCRPQDIDFHVPPEYLINAAIRYLTNIFYNFSNMNLLLLINLLIFKRFLFLCRDKLAPVKLNRYKDDLLFYMFYTNVGDVLQVAAAAEL